MSEEMGVGLSIGPFAFEKKDAVLKAIESLTNEFEPAFEPEFTDTGDGTYLEVDFGVANHGTYYLAADGKLPELIALEVPYVFRDTGSDGFRNGRNFTWHPSYGEVIRTRQEDGFGKVILTEEHLDLIGPRSNEELGRAIKAYFAAPGSTEAVKGWPVWDDDYEPPAAKAHRLMLTTRREIRKLGQSNEVDEKEVMAAIEADEPAVHLVGNLNGGYAAYGPYVSMEEAFDRHEPEIHEVLGIFDRDLNEGEAITSTDINPDNYGALWCWGNLADGFSARGIYSDVEVAIEANDGEDGFVVALAGPLQ